MCLKVAKAGGEKWKSLSGAVSTKHLLFHQLEFDLNGFLKHKELCCLLLKLDTLISENPMDAAFKRSEILHYMHQTNVW